MLRILYQSSLSLSVMMLTCLLAVPVTGFAAPPVADMHLHYKWSQQDVTSPEQAVAALSRENIVLGVVIGTPAALAEHAELMARFPGMEHDEPYIAHVAASQSGDTDDGSDTSTTSPVVARTVTDAARSGAPVMMAGTSLRSGETAREPD